MSSLHEESLEIKFTITLRKYNYTLKNKVQLYIKKRNLKKITFINPLGSRDANLLLSVPGIHSSRFTQRGLRCRSASSRLSGIQL